MSGDTPKAIVIGGSAGSLDVLLELFNFLPKEPNVPLIIVTHIHTMDDGGVVHFFNKQMGSIVTEASDKETVQPGFVYFPPSGYHLQVEPDLTFSLSVDEKVNYARPSIDVLFESAAFAWGNTLVGIILTGANADGANGIRAIKKYGGRTIAQDPSGARYPVMPQAAIDTGAIDTILSVQDIGQLLHKISTDNTQQQP
jgi:two-component system chemotaxis response regulator CheB